MTHLLREWSGGDREAGEELLSVVYDALRRGAAAQLRRERKEHTLQPTALVHEAYLRLHRQKRVQWRNRVQFFVIASQMMRRVLLDHARGRRAAKREGSAVRVAFDDNTVGGIEPRGCDLLQLDRALTDLARLDPRQAGIVELFYFGGLSEEEIGDAVSLSRSTVARELRSAKAWLYQRMTTGGQARA